LPDDCRVRRPRATRDSPAAWHWRQHQEGPPRWGTTAAGSGAFKGCCVRGGRAGRARVMPARDSLRGGSTTCGVWARGRPATAAPWRRTPRANGATGTSTGPAWSPPTRRRGSAWLARHPGLHLHLLPPCAPELNLRGVRPKLPQDESLGQLLPQSRSSRCMRRVTTAPRCSAGTTSRAPSSPTAPLPGASDRTLLTHGLTVHT